MAAIKSPVIAPDPFRERRERETVWIPACDLQVDISYQRTFDIVKVREYTNNWDDRACGVLVVNLRDDGSLYVIDGQHRLLAFRRRSAQDAPLPCAVYYGLSRREEAHLFAIMNGRRRQPSRPQVFRANFVAREPVTMAIVEIVHGLEMGIRGIDPRVGERSGEHVVIQAVGCLESVYRQYGGDMLRIVLELIRDTWGFDHEAYESWMVKGIRRFLTQYGDEYDRRSFVDKLGRHRPGLIRSNALVLGTAMNGARDKSVMAAIVNIYNSGRRTHALRGKGASE